MRKSLDTPDGQRPEENVPQLRARRPLAASEPAMTDRIRALRAEARAVYAQLNATMPAAKREKK